VTNTVVERLRASLLRQAAVHGAAVSEAQADAIARNLAAALLYDADCPDCGGVLGYQGRTEIACSECGRIAVRFVADEQKTA